ncbi:glycosyltransferase family 2 protein [Enterococcus cecorum]|uniref:glycosyltransferase family 2 protein n=1 Tax=Enterococcus cecorum TaxID=44008 RepID=UPI000DE8EBF5|nr:glycosyltransferase [Enterococcus cecorum]RBR31351.1 hypothetical protein EB08_00648 [Enterococcus cecorum]RBR34674.1 hypothetical protein EB31_01670 [Enterococcus cecorum]RBR38284.1 hypothetical protein EB26_00106 [Enterococcus cecorum]
MVQEKLFIQDSLVSVIVPVYNSEKYVERCILSILNQTYSSIELILINDGSTDSSLNILDEYSRKDNRIILVNKENEGVSASRNLGIEIATGKYLMFIDNDDFVEPSYVETYVSEIEKYSADLIIGGYQRVNSEKILFKDYPRDANWGKYVILSPWAKIYRTELIKNNDIKFLDYPIGEDIYFNFQVFKYTNQIYAINNLGYHWFFNGQSISNTSQRGFNNSIDILYFLNKLISVSPNDQKYYIHYFINRYYVWYLLFNGRNSNYRVFISEHKKIKEWLANKDIHLVFNPLSRKFEGEGYKNRIIVFTFKLIEKLNLVRLFAKIYCKK